jgi:hypothetical protein
MTKIPKSKRSQRSRRICPPKPREHATFAQDHEYKRLGTLRPAEREGPRVKDRHRSREFIEFVKLLDAAYPARTAIKLILDNHAGHICKETKEWLAAQQPGRFEFTFTPTHGSWLNPHRDLLFQLRPLRSPSHPCGLKTGAQAAHHGRHR